MSKKDKNSTNEPLSDYGEPVSFNDVWKMFRETDKKFKDTDRKIDRLAKLYGGVSEDSEDAAEEFFRRCLESRNAIFGIEYNEVDHLARKSGKLQGEYDIVLHNKEYIIVIEVKYKLHPDDVEDIVNRKLSKFKRLFTEYGDKRSQER